MFEDIKFSYEDDRALIDCIEFEMQPGTSTAVVGPSGCGKSTLLKLLYRFYDPVSGRITIDDQNIQDVNLESLRKTIGVVPQDTVLFNDSLFYNIAYGRPSASVEEIEQAAKFAEIHDTILSMPAGYDTVVGERGLKLSGGEKQRIAIARMMLKDPKIVVCDEATSALDTATETEILGNLKKLTREKTSLFIAHRLSTIADADQILVLDKGRVVEVGKHDFLLKAGGIYMKMWQLQNSN